MKIKKHITVFLFFLTVNFSLVLGVRSTRAETFEIIPSEILSVEALAQVSERIEEEPLTTIEGRETIRVYFPETDSIDSIETEEYIIGVLTGEMYSDAPAEALKAVAVAARSYTLYMCEQNKNKEYDVVADSSVSQAYLSRADAEECWNELGVKKYDLMREAINETKGEVLIFNGEIICALYHASSYPYTENNENVFVQALDYLTGGECVEGVDDAYISSVSYTEDEFNLLLEKNEFPRVDFNTLEIEAFKNENERCKYLSIYDESVGFTVDGRQVRDVFSLNSTSFEIEKDDTVTFIVFGFGHGVGLSQNGACVMARKGSSYHEILEKYYKGAHLAQTIYK